VPAVAQAQSILIRNATLIDMLEDEPQSNMNILVLGERIERIWGEGERAPRIPRNTVEIDATGQFVLPSFIDSHVHYNWYMGELFLVHGITTVADLGSRIYWQKAVRNGLNSGELRGPRYLFCGRIGDESPVEYASAARRNLFATASQPSEVPQAIADIKANADCVRMPMDAPQEMFQAITREANRTGMGVIAHSYDVRDSIAVGVNGIEHLEGVALATIRSEEGLAAVEVMQLEEGHKHPLLYQWMEERYFDEVINDLVSNNVYLNPTLIHEWKGVNNRTDEFEQDDLRLFTHPELQYFPMDEKLVSMSQFHWADLAMGDFSDDQQIFVNNSYFLPAKGLKQSLEIGYTKIQDFLRRFVQAGGKLYSGTDTAASSTPGISLHHEMQLLVDAGVPEMETLLSSTLWAAELFRIDDDFGSIERGKFADILILDDNPLEDIANTKKINTLIKAGQQVDITFHADYTFPFPQHGTVSKHQYHQPPVINNVNPPIANENTETTITITGEDFMPETVAILNGEVLQTEYISASEMKAVLTRQHTLTPGSYLLSAETPAPGGGQAVPVEFIVDFRE
jgi:hypothetical protein